MPVKILATADIHIGRSPTRVPDSTRNRSSCARMWSAIVELAIREQVDLVALSGDIIDHRNRFFESTGPLETGLARLAAAGIHTYAVAGNHDHDVLPRIVDAVGTDHFHLLGRNGHWERADFPPDGPPRLRIWGWSFPDSHFETNPLASWEGDPDDDLPAVGLLHADLDVPASRYAPVSRTELASHPLAVWLLGHIHAPQLHEMQSGPTLLYPGSPQAMDPGETGPHGPWLIEVHGRHNITAPRQIPLSKVLYSALEVDLSDVETEDALDACLLKRTGMHLKDIAHSSNPPEFVSLRIQFTGRTRLCGQVDDYFKSLELERSFESVTQNVDQVTNHTLPAINLQQLAQQHDPPGILARTLLELHAGQSSARLAALLDEAHQKQREVFNSHNYATLSEDALPDVSATRQRLLRQGNLLLDRLLAQDRSP